MDLRRIKSVLLAVAAVLLVATTIQAQCVGCPQYAPAFAPSIMVPQTTMVPQQIMVPQTTYRQAQLSGVQVTQPQVVVGRRIWPGPIWNWWAGPRAYYQPGSSSGIYSFR